jgi:hypothetical protein
MSSIIDQKGSVFHSSTFAYENAEETNEFLDIINKLP